MGKLVSSLAATFVLVACSSSQTTPDTTTTPRAHEPVTTLPPVSSATLTTTATLVSRRTRENASVGPNPAQDPASFGYYIPGGFGELDPGAPLAYVTRTMAGQTPPAPGPNAKRLLRFVHMPDLQIADDESPNRLAAFDAAADTQSAARTQDADLCWMTNAAVRTINAIDRADPVSFVLLGGDIADSAQSNEVDWALGILDGAPSVECDSGADDDIIPGPGNDGKDPFATEGLHMPFKWVTGNHDVCVQGNFPLDVDNTAVAVGDNSVGGTRDYAQLGGPISKGEFVVPDPRRQLLTRQALMTKVAGDADGHGLGAAQVASGKAIYTFDAENTPFRFLVLDTAAETGGSEGILHQADVDSAIKPALDQALADGKYVILASHHAVSSLTLDGSTFGTLQADALTKDQWMTFIGGYPNVVFSMVGHAHVNRVNTVTPANGGHAWWEVMTASIADYPHEFRVVEIFDQDNGWLMLRGTVVDFSTENDPLAEDARTRGEIDWLSGWGMDGGMGTPADRDVEVWIQKPAAP